MIPIFNFYLRSIFCVIIRLLIILWNSHIILIDIKKILDKFLIIIY